MPLPDWISAPRTWNLVAHGYAEEIVPTFSQFAEDALQIAKLVPGERVLDVATGPGTLALAAARAGARVSAIDFSPQMIDELRTRARNEQIAGIDARVADARALPDDDAAFDAVFSMFALNLIADREAAFREIRRVVRPGGRVVVGTPASITHQPGFADVRDIVRRAIPSLDFETELPLGAPEELERELRAAGFGEVTTRRSTRCVRFGSIAAIWHAAGRAAAPVVVAKDEMEHEEWARASDEIVRALEARFGPGPHEIEIAVNFAWARA